MVVKCYAKINVVLNVNGVRESDGYHDLDMVMIPRFRYGDDSIRAS